VAEERFRLESIEWESTPYQNHMMASPAVSTVPTEMELPAGTYIVRMSQNAASLIAELMEPGTDDNVVAWNFLDHSIPNPAALGRMQQADGFFLPIYRVMRPAGMNATLIP
jgi:hypothetical protein